MRRPCAGVLLFSALHCCSVFSYPVPGNHSTRIEQEVAADSAVVAPVQAKVCIRRLWVALGVFRPGMSPGRFTSGGEYRLSDGALWIDNRKPDNGCRDEIKNAERNKEGRVANLMHQQPHHHGE